MRIAFASLLACLAFVTPASASQVLQVNTEGGLVRRDIPSMPPPIGPELAVPGGEQACPLPKPQASAAAGPSVTSAIASARRRGTITAAESTRYRRSYASAKAALRGLKGRNRTELRSVVNVMGGIARRGQLTGGRMPALFLQLDRNR